MTPSNWNSRVCSPPTNSSHGSIDWTGPFSLVMSHDQHWFGPVARSSAWSIGDGGAGTAFSNFQTFATRIEHKYRPSSSSSAHGRRSFVDKLSAVQDLHNGFPFGRAQGALRPEAEDPRRPFAPKFLPIQSMAADPEPDSRHGLRGIVRIAKLRPSALVSVLFAARQRDSQQLRFFLEIQHGFKLLELAFQLPSLHLPQLMIQRIDRLCLSSPLARGQCLQSSVLALASPGLQIRPVKPSRRSNAPTSPDSSQPGLLQDPELIAG